MEVFIRRAKFGTCFLLAVGVWQEGGASAPASKEHRIPLQNRNGLIYIAAVVNRNHVTLLLDTGAGMTAFDTKIAPPVHAGAITTLELAKGSMLAYHTPVEFTLGEEGGKEGSCSFKQEVVVGNFSFNGAEGAVGLDVLSSFKAVTVDFRNSVLVLIDR